MKIVLGLALFASTSAWAAFRCDNCATSQKQAWAVAAGPGIHYVIDYPANDLSKWEVQWVVVGENCQPNRAPQAHSVAMPPAPNGKGGGICTQELQAFGQTLEADEIEIAQKAFELYTANGSSTSATVEMTMGAVAPQLVCCSHYDPQNGLYMTAYDVANDPYARLALVDWAKDSPLIQTYLATAQRLLQSLVGLRDFSLVIQVTFLDGTKALLSTNVQTGILGLDSTTDLIGGPVWTRGTPRWEMVGRFEAPPGASQGAVDNWMTNARHAGATIVDSQWQDGRHWACVTSLDQHGNPDGVICHFN
jgi:hypothetical protein